MRVKRGNQIHGPDYIEVDPNNHCRTDAQFRALMRIEKLFEPDFWCGDPLTPEHPGQKFNCSFLHTFYRNGYFTCLWITPTGIVKEFGEGHQRRELFRMAKDNR